MRHRLLVIAIVLASITGFTAVAHGAYTVTGLKCEYLENPLGIDSVRPRLSWIVESDERSQVQTSYQVIVASDRKNLDRGVGDLWDSGKTASSRTVNVPYEGAVLSTGRHCWWKVRSWDRYGRMSSWSAPAFWSMGILSPTDWRGKWIGYPERPKVPPFVKGKPAPSGPPAPYFRKEFRVNKPVKSAVLSISARGMVVPRLNGKPVSDDVFAPEYTDYAKRIQYRTYDVARLLKRGGNTLGAVVGDGWYTGYIGIIMIRDFYGPRTGLLADLRIQYTDGTRDVIATDAAWRCAEGPIISSDMLLGENYDARRDMPGWDRPGFDDSGWKNSEVLEPTDAVLTAQPSQPVRIVDSLKPVAVTEPKPGVFVFDMGQNFAGWARLTVKGPAGTMVTLRFAEMVNPDGTIYTENLRNARSTDTYTLRGDGVEIWEPSFTFHGFRYVEVTGFPGTPTAKNITGRVITSTTPPAGSFTCSNPMVNRLWSNIRWSQLANFISIPTDCPQRDERQGWMGDAQIFFRTAAYNADVSAFFTKWMRDVNDEQSPEGAFRDTSPFVGHGLGGDGAPAWGDAGVIVPWAFHTVYGDTLMLRSCWPFMEKWMSYLERLNPDFVRKNPKHSYGDWLSINADTPKDLLATAYWADDARMMSRIAEILGIDDARARYDALFGSIRDAFRREFVTGGAHIKGETQTGYLLALAMNLLPESSRADAAALLVKNIERNGWRLSTGFLGVRYLCPILTEKGYPDVAYRLLLQEEFPSWGYSIRHGATSIWERWNGWTAEKGFFDPGMNSFNHYSLGSVGEWLYESVAGIGSDPDHPGYEHIVIRPVIGPGLTHARADYRSIRGHIASGWGKNGNNLTLRVVIPANTTATIYVPSLEGSAVLESGKPAEKAPGLAFVKNENGYAVFEAGSGSYTFTSTVAK